MHKHLLTFTVGAVAGIAGVVWFAKATGPKPIKWDAATRRYLEQ